MPDTPADPVAAALEDIDSRHYPVPARTVLVIASEDERVCESDHHKWPCHAHLLGDAVAKVLERHSRQEQPVITRTLCGNHARSYVLRGMLDADRRAVIDACPDCVKTEHYVCKHCQCPHDEWPCPTYRDIATALLGEVPADGQ